MPLPQLRTDYGPDPNMLLMMMKQQRENQLLQREDEQRKLLGNALAQGMSDDPQLANIMRQSPEAGLKLMQVQSAQAEQRNALREMERKEEDAAMGEVANVFNHILTLPEEQRQPVYEQQLGRLAQAYPMVAQRIGHMFPQTADPGFMKSIVAMRTPVKDQIGMNTPKMQEVQVGDQTKYFNVFPDGRREEIPGMGGPKWNDNQGLEVSLPDGTVISQGKKKGGTTSGLGQVAQNDVEKGLLNEGAGLSRVQQVKKQFKPEYQELKTRFGTNLTAWKEKAGLNVSDTDKKLLNDFTQYKSSASTMIAQDLKEMSGSAVTPQEAQRAEGFIPKAGTGIFDGDSPTEMEAKIKQYEVYKRRAIARYNYIRKHGFSIKNAPPEMLSDLESNDPKSMNYLRDPMNKRGMELEPIAKQYYPQANPEQLRQVVRQWVADEYGLVN